MVTEFGFIDNIKSRYRLTKVGDDCAVLPKDSATDMVITADLLIEDIDFRLGWATPEQIGHKALAVSLSDIAAMGAEPKWAMLSLGFPQAVWKTGFVDRFYEGWHALATEFGIELIGGDVSRSPEKSVIDSIAGGEVPRGQALLRSGARPGDRIYVSGTLGAAAAGLDLLISQRLDGSTAEYLIEKQLRPMPQVRLAKKLIPLGLVNSLIDLSDGLSSDLGHICHASGVGARIDRERLPIDPHVAETFEPEKSLDLALNGGEDFQLLFSASGDLELEGVTQVGVITADAGRLELVDGDKVTPLEPLGFRHF